MFIIIKKLEQMRNLAEEKELTPGQQIWIDGKSAVFLFSYPNSNIQYVVYGKPHDITNTPVLSVWKNEISTTPPLPEIKPGTPVLCWDDKYAEKSATIWLFQKYSENGQVVVGDLIDDAHPLTFNFCKVYEF